MNATTRLLMLAALTIGAASCSKDKAVEKTTVSCNCEENAESYQTTSKRSLATGVLNGAEVTYDKVDGLNIFEGDIVLSEDQIGAIGGSVTAGSGITSATKKWPGKVVYYTYGASATSSTISKFQTAMDHWTLKTGITFVARTNQADYIEVIQGSGCYSSIGRVGGKQQLSIGSSCSSGNAIHEIGHAIGMFHEHTRLDRDSYVIINTGNIESGYAHNFNKHAVSGTFDNGVLDFGSIMMYGSYSFSSNGNPTITRLNGTTFNVQRTSLSTNDITAVTVMYP